MFVIPSIHWPISLGKFILEQKDHLRQFFEGTSEAQRVMNCKELLELFH